MICHLQFFNFYDPEDNVMWNTTFSDTLFFYHTQYILEQNIFPIRESEHVQVKFQTNSGARNEQVQF